MASRTSVRTGSTGAWSQDVPRLPRVYVARTQLWQRLDEVTENPLTLLVGPMGSGKTLGVSGWVRLGRHAPAPEDAANADDAV